jgi:hypothetical protein
MITFDTREKLYKRPDLRAAADKIEPLWYVDPTNPTARYSYDVKIEATNGAFTLRGEIKQFSDAISSWIDGKLARQINAVDFFMLEWDPMDILVADPSFTKGHFLSMWKHLAVLSLSCPVIFSDSAETTATLLRHLETRSDLEVRANRVKGRSESVRHRILGDLPGISSHARITALEAKVDWSALVAALRLDAPPQVPGVASGTVGRIKTALLGPVA